MRILVVEDDQTLGDGISRWLREYGYATDWMTEGKQGYSALESEDFDCVILDINLPDISGLDVLRQMRKSGKQTPVLLLTACDMVSDRVTGLDSGADDYLTKPFDLDELSARIRALLRRHSGHADPVIRYRNIIIDPAARTVSKEGGLVDLSSREFALLQLLIENAGKVLTRDRIEQSLYSWRDHVSSNAVEVHVHHLRKKFGTDLIRTVRGAGYITDRE
jgi:DNA-binding response OmpR family regulator